MIFPSIKGQALGISNAVSSTYDQTKTTIAGTVALQTVQSQPVIAPPLVQWFDMFTDAGIGPQSMDYTINGRLFAISAISGGSATLAAYNFNSTTGVHTYIGKVILTFPNQAATTHTIRGFKVDDTTSSAIKVFITTTGTVAINGGSFMLNNVNITDFVQVAAPTFGFATGSNQKAMYFLQDPSNISAGQLQIASVGSMLDRTGQILYAHNGTAATHQYYTYNYANTPNVPGSTCTLTIASPGVVNLTSHGYNAGDVVTFSTTGALPTGLVAGTVYFVIATGLTTNSFEVAATSGGAAINFTGSQSGTQTVYRGFGITSSLWNFKTGNVTALSGTLLANNSERRVVPNHTALSGSQCGFMATTTNLYLFLISDLSSGATSLPSLVTANLLGSTNQVVSPTAVNADWDTNFDRAVFTTSTTKIIAKQMVNNVIQDIYGILNNDYLEGQSQSSIITQYGAVTVTDMKTVNGWNIISGSSTGQRGMIAINTGADSSIGSAYMISPVLTLPITSNLIALSVLTFLPDNTSYTYMSYRTNGFSTATGGWISLPSTGLFPMNTSASQVQIMWQWEMNNPLISEPEMIIESLLSYQPITNISDYWEGDIDNSTQNGVTPMYVAFRQRTAYTTLPTTGFTIQGSDDTGSIIYNFNTVSNASIISQSNNNGTSWTAWTNLAGFYNSALTGCLRVNVATPSGTRLTWSISEY